MRKRLFAGTMALVLSVLVMASPILAAEESASPSEDPIPVQPPVSGESLDQTPPSEVPPASDVPPQTPPAEPPSSDPPAPEKPPVSDPVPPPPVEIPEGPPLRQDHVKYMEGFPQRTFQPGKQLTRAQAAQVVYRLLAAPDSGTGSCSYTDVPNGQWYAKSVRALCALGLFDNGSHFRPNDIITRAEFVDLLIRVKPQAPGTATFPDVPASHWAAKPICAAASQGWINGYPDGTFRPDNGLSRAEACTVINRMLGRTGDAEQASKLLTLGVFSDMTASHWAGTPVVEAAVSHTPTPNGSGERWSDVDLAAMTFQPGFHEVGELLYSVDQYGKLALNTTFGAFRADSTGALTRLSASYQIPNVPYHSQIDNIYAWVGCEAVSTLMGLQAKGYAAEVPLKQFLDDLPRHSSNPEKGFVGSPYVPDPSKRTRTTIYPAKLAEYSNSYCNGQPVCADFRGASVTDLQRELLAGNCVVAYMTLWWEKPNYRTYQIEGTPQRLVSNNHAVLVCGYDPEKGYFISDPYNYYNRGEVHQYWKDAKTFDAIWKERQVGMVLR